MIKIPTQNKRFSQTNESDTSGNIYQTKNISFDEKGVLKLAPRSIAIYDDNQDADFGSQLVDVTWYHREQELFAVTPNGYFNTGNIIYTRDLLDMSQNAETGVPTPDIVGNSSLTVWNDDVNATNDTSTYYRWDGNWDSISGLGIITEFSCVFENLNQLFLAEGDEAVLVNTSGVVQTTLQLPQDYAITSCAWNNNRMYITTENDRELSNTLVFEWDGLTSEANNAHKVESNGTYSAVPYKDGVMVITKEGEYKYIRSGSTSVTQLPVYFFDDAWNVGPTNSVVNIEDKIHLGIDPRIANYTYADNLRRMDIKFPGGVWCLDDEVGAYHKYSLSTDKLTVTNNIATTSVNTTTNVITVAGATIPETGTPCIYNSDATTGITGLKSGSKYYVIKDSSTELRLAETYADAIADSEIDITGTGNNLQNIMFAPNNDFGGIYNAVSAAAYSKSLSGDITFNKGVSNGFFFGGYAQDGSDTGRSTSTLNTASPILENRGYFVTPKFESNSIEDKYNSIIVKWRKFKNPEDKIIVKYKTSSTETDKEINTYDVSQPVVTWTSSTTFTTTEDLTNVSVGDEVEIISGQGAGYLPHITSLSESSGTWTVTIDEAIQNFTNSEYSSVLFLKWKKIEEVGYSDADNDIGYKVFKVNKTGKYIQFKIELRGVETTIEELIINNQEHKPVI